MLSHSVSNLRDTSTWKPLGIRVLNKRLVVTVLSLLVSISISVDVIAARHRSSYYHRRAFASAQAQRVQMIRSLKAQVSAANQVLKTAESQSSMTADKIQGLMKNLDDIRHDMAQAHVDIHNAAKELRLIEADILDEQADDSDYAKAEHDLAEANAALIHLASSHAPEIEIDQDVQSWSDMLAKLSKQKTDEVKADPEFKESYENLLSQQSRIANVRRKLFERDKKWIAAKQELDKASRHSRTEVPDARPDAVRVLTEKQELQQLQMVISNARAIATQGELRLRQLGVNTSTNRSNASRSK